MKPKHRRLDSDLARREALQVIVIHISSLTHFFPLLLNARDPETGLPSQQCNAPSEAIVLEK